MTTVADHLVKSVIPTVGAQVAGWPWWAVASLVAASCGSTWVSGWLDVVDRVRHPGRPDP
jgi:hypothetical protein